MKRAFEEAGLREISEQRFDIPDWRREGARISVDRTHHTKLDCIALPKSPSSGVEGELVYLEHGLLEDFRRADVEGKIVIVRSDVPDWYEHWLHRLVKYRIAVRRGAVGFVFANHVEGYLPPTGSVGIDFDQVGSIPAVGVSREGGGGDVPPVAQETNVVERAESSRVDRFGVHWYVFDSRRPWG